MKNPQKVLDRVMKSPMDTPFPGQKHIKKNKG